MGSPTSTSTAAAAVAVAPCPTPALTVLVAGCQRTGKTSLVRLLLETAEVAASPSPLELQSIVKFVHGAARPTSAFREAAVRVHGPAPTSEPIALRIIDSPGLDYEDEAELEHGLAALLRNIEARFSETAVANTEDAHDQHIHLCIYLLDPDDIIPEITRQAYRSGYARPKTAQATSSDESDFESEDDGNGNSTRLKQRPSIPPAEIAAMKRLATRVNLLPVIARTDALTEARLRAIKRAVKRDLAHAGLSFGVFDPLHEKGSDPTRPSGPSPNSESAPSSVLPPTPVSPRHCDASHASLRPATEIASLLPFALISPDRYSYGDGVVRRTAKKATLQEIAAQFSPSKGSDAAKGKERDEPPGRFTRRYKWGTVDVLDPAHCDFVALKTAVLAIHREALRAKTRDLFAQFIQDQRNIRTVNEDRRQNSDPLAPAWQHQYPTTQPSHGHPPGSQHSPTHQHPHHNETNDGRYFGPPMDGGVGQFQAGSSDMYTRVIPLTVSRGPRAKTKKILVACNFCRSRKLKCDGGRPQCAQCQRRGLECSYEDTLKRRGVGRPPRDDESVNGEEDDTGTPGGSSNGRRAGGRERTDSRSGDGEMTSPGANRKISPANSRTMSPVTRRGSPAVAPLPATGQIHVGYIPPRPLSVTSASVSIPTPPLGQSTERHNHHHPAPPPPPAPREHTRAHKHHSHPPGGPGTTMMVMTMPFPGSMGGSKATACSFCKTRKTKCDGHRPSCSNCRKKQVECFYPEDGRARQHHHQQHHQPHHVGGEDVKPRTGSAMSLEQQQRERDRAQASIDHAHAQAMHQHTFHQQPFQHHSIAGSKGGGPGRGGPGEPYYPHHPTHHMPPHPSHHHHPNHIKRSSSHSPPPPHHRYAGSPPPVLPPIQSGAPHPGPGYHHRHPLPPPHPHSQHPLPALRNSNGSPPPPGYHHHPRSPQPYYRGPPPPGSGSPPRPGSGGVDRPSSRTGRPVSRHMSPPRSASRGGMPMEIDQDVREASRGSSSSFAKRKSVDESLSPAFKRARVDDRDGFDRERHEWPAPPPGGHEPGMNGHGHHYYSDRERYDAERERYESRERYEAERERYERDHRERFDPDRERYEAERERYEDRDRYDADRERERYEAERERREPLSAERYEQPQPPISADRYDRRDGGQPPPDRYEQPPDRYDKPPISADRYEPYERPRPPSVQRAGSPTRRSVEKEGNHARYAPSLRHRSRSRSRSNESAPTAVAAAAVNGNGPVSDARRGAEGGGDGAAARRPGGATEGEGGGRRSGDGGGQVSPKEMRTASGDRLVESRYLPPPVLPPIGAPSGGGQWTAARASR